MLVIVHVVVVFHCCRSIRIIILDYSSIDIPIGSFVGNSRECNTNTKRIGLSANRGRT